MSENENPDPAVIENDEKNPEPTSKSKSLIRQQVTPDPFHVDPSLLGKPLATPMRRGIALLIDLTCVAVFSSLGISFLIALSGYFFARYAKRRYTKMRRLFSIAIGYTVLIFGLLIFAAIQFTNIKKSISPNLTDHAFLPALMKLTAENEGNVKASARSIGEEIRASVEDENLFELEADIYEGINALPMSDERRGWILEGLTEAFSESPDKIELSSPDSENELDLTNAHLTALENESESEDVAHTREALKQFLAGAELETLEANKQAIQDEKDALVKKLQHAEKPWAVSILTQTKALAEDIGITFFWSTLYFTALIGLFQGRTIGKRLMGVRVISLDGRNLSVWNAFERHGGYIAGVATGLMGFIQILWDPNRQTIEDKIAGTVVVRD